MQQVWAALGFFLRYKFGDKMLVAHTAYAHVLKICVDKQKKHELSAESLEEKLIGQFRFLANAGDKAVVAGLLKDMHTAAAGKAKAKAKPKAGKSGASHDGAKKAMEAMFWS